MNKDTKQIFSAYLIEAAPAQLNAPPVPAQPTPTTQPAAPAAPTAPGNVTGQQIVDFFEQKKNIMPQVSQTLSELANNPVTTITNPRDVIATIMQETQYSQEIPKADLSNRFLAAIKDYETALTYQSPVRIGPSQRPSEDISALAKERGTKTRSGKKTEEDKMRGYMDMFINILKNQPGVTINNTAVANAQAAVQNQVDETGTKIKSGKKVTAKVTS
jgi:hypothetical protein